MIYTPIENPACVVIRNDTTMRIYDEVPRLNSTISYTDYFYTSNYLYQEENKLFHNIQFYLFAYLMIN